jgi:D-alanine--poly(phosphoribitol) ligase subunit 1
MIEGEEFACMKSFFLSAFWNVLDDESLRNKIAVKSVGASLTYLELKSWVLKVRSFFSCKSFPNKLVGLMTSQDPEVYAAILGIVSSGNGYVPINVHHPIARIISVIETAGIDSIIVVNRTDVINEVVMKLPHLKIIFLEELPKPTTFETADVFDKEQIAYLLFTSGSTGKPKGVPIYLRNLDSFLKTLITGKYGFNKEDQILQMFELTFDFSIFPIFLNFSIGGTLHIVSDSGIKPLKVFELLNNEKITVAAMVPSIITYLKKFLKEVYLPEIRVSLFCGEALYDDILELWSAVCPNALQINFYGPTEATVFCMEYLWRPNLSSYEAVNGIVPIGKPMKGTQCYIVNENNEIMNGTSAGELCLFGSQVTDRYWKDKSKTRDSFVNVTVNDEIKTVYKTGDICFINKNGNYIYCGRVDDQVKINGYRIELSEIEFHVRQHTNIDNVACVAVSESENIFVIYAFIESSVNMTFELEKYLKQNLPVYMIPSHIRYVEQMPLNKNGKIDRIQLKKYALC